jgi:hypothetical protein
MVTSIAVAPETRMHSGTVDGSACMSVRFNSAAWEMSTKSSRMMRQQPDPSAKWIAMRVSIWIVSRLVHGSSLKQPSGSEASEATSTDRRSQCKRSARSGATLPCFNLFRNQFVFGKVHRGGQPLRSLIAADLAAGFNAPAFELPREADLH